MILLFCLHLVATAGSPVSWKEAGLLPPLIVCPPPAAEESQGELEVKDPCACDRLVEFQQATMSSLEQLALKHILC